ncbi:MAG: hypothetical protein Ct9H300mP3_06470 [Gammaproteobacteria bacterium]|nr:MAG: hypothetical protein Ct9H300mP3_06470 [Gammaproteobacteria bacterium]
MNQLNYLGKAKEIRGFLGPLLLCQRKKVQIKEKSMQKLETRLRSKIFNEIGPRL